MPKKRKWPYEQGQRGVFVATWPRDTTVALGVRAEVEGRRTVRQLLSGIKVVELAEGVAGSYCAKLFADLGARRAQGRAARR